jgi:hypothetical protein
VAVQERVYRAVAERASAAVIGVPVRLVSAAVVERRDGISLRVSTPLPVPDLGDTEAIARAVPVRERARELQEQVQRRVTEVFGRDVGRVALTITGAVIPDKRRVR